jgi:predicted dinucleotide-binding enzyme
MRIGILGARSIGGTLGRKWAHAGHTVMFGVRNPQNSDVQALAHELGGNASAAGVANAIAFGEVVVFAIPGQAMDASIVEHAAALAGKTIVDASNKVGAPTMNSLEAFTTHAPSAQVFRAFNSLGWENFANPQFGGVQADLFYCGPSSAAQAQVEQLIADVGLRPVWVGGPEYTPTVDAIASLWFALALKQGRGRHLAFKLLTDES